MFEVLALGALCFLIVATFGICIRLLIGKHRDCETEDDRSWWQAIK
jgi:hypothetical protein